MPLGYPDGPGRSFPNQFSASALNSSSTSILASTLPTGNAAGFGFNASKVRVVVDAGTAYLNFGTTSAPSTGDYKMTSGESMELGEGLGVTMSGLSFAATSTGVTIRVGAWG